MQAATPLTSMYFSRNILWCQAVIGIIPPPSAKNRGMVVLFARSALLYLIIFAVIRLSGKRQLSDLQPFDLVFTLLVADLAAGPAGDGSIPLLYGIVPILALFLIQQLFAYLSLKLEGFRHAVCGRPVILVAEGIVQEEAMRAARYTLNDLMEQLRVKDIFTLSEVEYAILETNGQLSVLQRAGSQPVSREDLGISAPRAELPCLLVQDGRLNRAALAQSGYDEAWLARRLKAAGIGSAEELLFALLAGGELHLQGKAAAGGAVRRIPAEGGKA